VLVLAGAALYAERQAAADPERRERNAEAVASLLEQAEVALTAGDAAKAGPFVEAAQQRAKEGDIEAEGGRLARWRENLTAQRDLDAVSPSLCQTETPVRF
jgi:hypothetical protein